MINGKNCVMCGYSKEVLGRNNVSTAYLLFTNKDRIYAFKGV